jgi:hypothetical protein
MWLIQIGLLVLNTIAEGFVLSILWSWFMVTTFGLPAISIPVAIGISLLVSVTTLRIRNENLENTDSGTVLIKALIRFFCLFLLLGIGWVVHFFV